MWKTIGHARAIRIIERSLDKDRLSHAYLLVGPPSVGKKTLATDIAKAVNCLNTNVPCQDCSQCVRIGRGTHADVYIIEPFTSNKTQRARSTISIDQIRNLQREASLKPYEGKCRVYIFGNVEHLSEEASNCLLKTLEEPPTQVMLILLATNMTTLLPTLVSRCQLLELHPVPLQLLSDELQSTYGVGKSISKEIAHLSSGKPGWAIEASRKPDLLKSFALQIETIDKVFMGNIEDKFAYSANLSSIFGRDRNAVRQELALWLTWWHDILLSKEQVTMAVTHLSKIGRIQNIANCLTSTQIIQVIKSVQETKENLERNTNPRLAIDNMILSLPQI